MIKKKRTRRILQIYVMLIIMLFGAHVFAQIGEEAPSNPNSAKGCAICHYRWVDTFFVEGRGSDLVPYQSEKVAADEDMCFSCHDGSVMDSRARVRHGKEHETNVKPPPGMEIPGIFPLDDEGRMQCATCHTAHGVASGPDVEEAIFMRTSNRDSAMCRMCHTGKSGGPEAGNHSLGKSEQMIPKSLKERGSHEGSSKNQMICETCHMAHGSKSEGYLVKGAGDSGLCLDCHSDKGMDGPGVEADTNHLINVKPNAATIPEKFLKDGAKLGYDGIITCQTCHDIHDNKTNQPALLIQKAPQSDFCLSCHSDKKRLKKTKHNLAISAKEEKNLQGQTVGEAGVCSACHLPHKPARKPYWKDDDMDRTTALCMSCHASGRFAENEKLAGYTHPVNMTLSKTASGADADQYSNVVREKDTLDLPLYNKFAVAEKKGKMTCATCHDTHGGPVRRSDQEPENGDSEATVKLLRKPSPQICKSCHADKFAVESSGHDLNQVFPEGNSMLEQQVPESDLCRNCHHIHNSEPQGFVWSRQISTPAGKKVEDQCTGCHSSDGLAPKMTVKGNSHPVNISPRGMPMVSFGDDSRSSELPLFNASGERTENGIMTCYTCHDPHSRELVESASGDYAVDEKGQPINRFLRMTVAPSSRLCISCHHEQAEVKNSDHNLVMTAPESKNAVGQEPFTSGVCGACHLVHNNPAGVRLWARQLGQGDHVMDRMCNSCHAENAVAAEKVPQVASHPETAFLDKGKIIEGMEGTFPLFDKNTGEPVKVGQISCASCHDAHSWGASTAVEEPGKVEGQATTSFLRPRIHEQVCKDCHGVDSLFRFKYFHKESERKNK